MRLPWFMHTHGGRNTLTGVMPTPCGSFVRSCADGRLEVAWYPMDTSFPGGDTRECKRLLVVDSSDEGDQALEQAVVDFMHSHPVLASNTRYDGPVGDALEWEEIGSGVIASHQTEDGLFYGIGHAGVVALEFLPKGGRGKRETLSVYATTCGEDVLRARINDRVRRRIAQAQARVASLAMDVAA